MRWSSGSACQYRDVGKGDHLPGQPERGPRRERQGVRCGRASFGARLDQRGRSRVEMALLRDASGKSADERGGMSDLNSRSGAAFMVLVPAPLPYLQHPEGGLTIAFRRRRQPRRWLVGRGSRGREPARVERLMARPRVKDSGGRRGGCGASWEEVDAEQCVVGVLPLDALSVDIGPPPCQALSETTTHPSPPCSRRCRTRSPVRIDLRSCPARFRFVRGIFGSQIQAISLKSFDLLTAPRSPPGPLVADPARE